VFHGPRQQELVKFLELPRPGRAPLQVAGHHLQVIGAGLLAAPVGTQHAGRDTEPVCEARDRGRWRSGEVVGHEPQPRQNAQLDRQPEALGGSATPAGVDERHVSRGEGEEPDQFRTRDRRERTQPLELLVGEHTGRHRRTTSRALA